MYEFDYSSATSLDDAASLLGADEEAKLVAGGMTLLPTLKLRLAKPSELIDLAAIPSLKGITRGRRRGRDRRDDPACRRQPLAESSSAAIPALAAMAGMIGDPAVRNRGTIGGSIANNDPAADYPARRRGARTPPCAPTSARSPADDFFTGMFETALAAGRDHHRGALPESRRRRTTRNSATRPRATRSSASSSRRTGGGVRRRGDRRRPLRVPRAGDGSGARQILHRRTRSRTSRSRDDGLNSDIHASAEYRAHLVNVMARRAVAACA